MILTIILIGVIVLLVALLYINKKAFDELCVERNRLWASSSNQNQDHRNEMNAINCKNIKLTAENKKRIQEVERLTNKIIEIKNHSKLVEDDAAQRIEDFKKHPIIACMSDGQVTILAEMLAYHIREIMDAKKEWVN